MESEKTFDAAIIGGGVIGCATAWRLAQAGLRAVIIERGKPGREASYAAGGMLAPFAEADEHSHFLELSIASRALYPEFSLELREAVGIDVEYRTEGTLYLSLTRADDEELERRWEWQRTAGLKITRLDASAVRKLEPLVSESLRWALEFPDDHQVDNRRLMLALEMASRAAGVTVLEGVEARQLCIVGQKGQKGQQGPQVEGVMTTNGKVRAGAVVIAAGSWSSLIAPCQAVQIGPVRGQMIALASPAPPVSHVLYSRRGYLIPRRSGILIAGSTTEHVGYNKSVSAGGIASIIESSIEMLPAARDLPITDAWAGLRPMSPDGLPIIGPDPQIAGLFYATGHYRNGILLAPITAQAVTELIVRGVSSQNLAPFSVTRFSHRGAAG